MNKITINDLGHGKGSICLNGKEIEKVTDWKINKQVDCHDSITITLLYNDIEYNVQRDDEKGWGDMEKVKD